MKSADCYCCFAAWLRPEFQIGMCVWARHLCLCLKENNVVWLTHSHLPMGPPSLKPKQSYPVASDSIILLLPVTNPPFPGILDKSVMTWPWTKRNNALVMVLTRVISCVLVIKRMLSAETEWAGTAGGSLKVSGKTFVLLAGFRFKSVASKLWAHEQGPSPLKCFHQTKPDFVGFVKTGFQ